MNEQQTRERASIHPLADVGQLGLTVSDLRRSVSFYKELIGLHVLDESNGTTTLGVADDPFLVLIENAGASEWPRGGRSHPGLYHFAILVPTRADLGRWLEHWMRQDMALPGQGDHFVSEALYLEDPDGHGIEIYRDRPRDEWEWQNGQVKMGVEPVDIRGLLEEAQRSADPFTSMPVGTTLGHIHLQVTDIDETARFYQDILGFDIVAQMPSALFISAGGYHHHIGANVWHSRNADPAPDNTVSLQHYTIDLPNSDARNEVVERIEAAGINVASDGDNLVVNDPSGIEIRFRLPDR